ncbi:hypothetical protein HRG_002264 [Hirsutella rhossiliensis]|uniref:Pheromone n=1 Tax=Hirsutella rhossiliensis TaxID=111463 RepID=A0A9P8N4N2_9HYPO|nr:uncharacterized protein HRG_02264 [Hirsutella rhossiliensis]KAH0966855.1 hypothetical protein HRG_02264 [Hirsutella rhossiliensis]
MKPVFLATLACLYGAELAASAGSSLIARLKARHDMAHCIIGNGQFLTHPENPFGFLETCFRGSDFTADEQHVVEDCVVNHPEIFDKPDDPWTPMEPCFEDEEEFEDERVVEHRGRFEKRGDF